MVPAPNEEAAETADSKIDLLSMIKIVVEMMGDIIDNMIQRSEQQYYLDLAGDQERKESSFQRQVASRDGMFQKYIISPSTGIHTIHRRPVEEQRGARHHEQKRDPIPASRSGSWENEKEPSPDGESMGIYRDYAYGR